MASRLVERAKSIFWGIAFGAGGLAGLYALVILPHDSWSAWDWVWRIVGILLLFLASWGSFLPDSPEAKPASYKLETTASHEELRGYTTTYDQNPFLAVPLAGLRRFDPTAAHTLFHTSREGAWGLRFVIVQLLYDRYADRWEGSRANDVMDKLVDDTRRDPCWLLLRACRSLRLGHYGLAAGQCAEAAARDPADPTPYVLTLYAHRGGTDPQRRRRAQDAYREALARAPLLFEAHEQMLHILALAESDLALEEVLQYARRAAQTAPDGTDEAFAPALGHRIVYERMASRDRAAARRYLADPGVAAEIALACDRSFDSPRYTATHRTLRLLHMAAGLHAVIGDVPRLRGELERAGRTIDLDLWNPFHDDSSVKAYKEARKLCRRS